MLTNSRTGLALPDDGGVGGDDIVDVTLHISTPTDYLSNSVGIFHVPTFANLPTTQNFIGRLCMTDDTGTVYHFTATGWDVLQDTKWQTYTPNLTTDGTAPNLSAVSRWGKYFRVGKHCTCQGSIRAAAGSTAGTGTYRVTLPLPAFVGEPTRRIGILQFTPAGSAFYVCIAFLDDSVSPNNFPFLCSSTYAGTQSRCTHLLPVTVTVPYSLDWFLEYELA